MTRLADLACLSFLHFRRALPLLIHRTHLGLLHLRLSRQLAASCGGGAQAGGGGGGGAQPAGTSGGMEGVMMQPKSTAVEATSSNCRKFAASAAWRSLRSAFWRCFRTFCCAFISGCAGMGVIVT